MLTLAHPANLPRGLLRVTRVVCSRCAPTPSVALGWRLLQQTCGRGSRSPLPRAAAPARTVVGVLLH